MVRLRAYVLCCRETEESRRGEDEKQMVGVGWDETLDHLVKCIHICELERKGGEQTKGGGKKKGI